jgi:hypothetical protein
LVPISKILFGNLGSQNFQRILGNFQRVEVSNPSIVVRNPLLINDLPPKGILG